MVDGEPCFSYNLLKYKELLDLMSHAEMDQNRWDRGNGVFSFRLRDQGGWKIASGL